MLAFIDESGDPGLKLDSGSSSLFIVVLLAFDDHDEAQITDERIDSLRRELGLSDRLEFHFNKLHSRKKDSHLYRSLISHRQVYVQFWPK